MDEELREKINASCSTADEFVKLYYFTLDKRRHKIGDLFHDAGQCIWNGNHAGGKDDIVRFFQDLPTSEHTITTLNVQPILDENVAGQLTYIINVGGTVKYDKDDQAKNFQQSFVITAAEDKWKIYTDVYRQQDALLTGVQIV